MDFKKIFATKVKTVAKSPIEFDTESYADIATKSEILRDIVTGTTFSIPLACVGKNGIYVFITAHCYDERQIVDIYNAVRTEFSFGAGVFTFVRTEDDDYYIHNGKPVKISYMLDKFENLYINNMRPETERIQLDFADELEMMEKDVLPEDFEENTKGGRVIDRVSSVYIRKFKQKAEQVKESTHKKEKVIYKDGQKYVKHPITKFGIMVDETYFPVADEDPWFFLKLTTFGGIAGFHKFKTGEWGKGLLYILTCGMFGVGYLIDIFSIITGTYSVVKTVYSNEGKQYNQEKLRIYVDLLDKKQKIFGFIFLLIGIGLVYLSYKYIYSPIILKIFSGISDNIQSSIQSTIGF